MAQEIIARYPEFQPVFVGRTGGPEEKIVPVAGFELFTIKVSGIARFFSIRNLLFPVRLIRALLAARRLLNQLRPAVVVGTGGYVSFPVLFWAQWKKVPNALQEQNSVPGLVTRLLAPRAHVVFLGFAEAGKSFSKLENLLYTGNPVRTGLNKKREEGATAFGFSPEKKTVFFFGGSQGARKLNEAVLGWIAENPPADVQVLWQTGPRWHQEIEARLLQKPSNVAVRPYIDDMAAAYAAADLVVCRAGALSIAELTVLGKPSILIPYELAAADHQTQNALALVHSGAALLLKEKELNSKTLAEMVQRMLKNTNELKKMGEKAKQSGRPDATRQMAEQVVKLASRLKPVEAPSKSTERKAVQC
jgi:UDP-N-acetylglucosamine--N-acetylmuramyl-(pentapeptide) pyrophosphoryl-undecaprenol N-acetylglucosamine transferase